MPPPALPVVTIAQPIERPYQPHEDFTGNVAASQSVDIRARVSGYLEKVFFEVGTELRVGDPLFQIDPRPFQAEVDRYMAQLAVAEVKLKQADIEYRRLKDLYDKESATQIEYERQQSLSAAAEADVTAAKAALERAQLDLDYAHITAPLAGRISRRLVDPGNLVQGGAGAATLLTNIVAMEPIHVYFDIDELTILQLSRQKEHRDHRRQSAKGTPVFVRLADEQDFIHEGTIDFVDNKVDTNTGTLRVRAVFPNAERLLYPGLFVRVRVHCGPAASAIMIAERALGQDQGQRFCYVASDKNVVEYRRVEVGPQEDELRVVTSGVGPQEWVIVNGLQRVRPGVTVAPQRVDMSSFVSPADGSEERAPAVPASGPAEIP
jgi:RND family efflux transporter MFP subunit